jgi:hypothetical protein
MICPSDAVATVLKGAVMYGHIPELISERICPRTYAGAGPVFQARGREHLKKFRRAEVGAKIFGVFRVKNHDFTPKNRVRPRLTPSLNTYTFHCG